MRKILLVLVVIFGLVLVGCEDTSGSGSESKTVLEGIWMDSTINSFYSGQTTTLPDSYGMFTFSGNRFTFNDMRRDSNDNIFYLTGTFQILNSNVLELIVGGQIYRRLNFSVQDDTFTWNIIGEEIVFNFSKQTISISDFEGTWNTTNIGTNSPRSTYIFTGNRYEYSHLGNSWLEPYSGDGTFTVDLNIITFRPSDGTPQHRMMVRFFTEDDIWFEPIELMETRILVDGPYKRQ